MMHGMYCISIGFRQESWLQREVSRDALRYCYLALLLLSFLRGQRAFRFILAFMSDCIANKA
jgi:hypothetical protein